MNDSSIGSGANYGRETGSEVEVATVLLSSQMKHILSLILVEESKRSYLLPYLRIDAD